MTTLLPLIQKEIEKEKHRIIHDQIIPWIMMFASSKGSVKSFQGKSYTFHGVLFDGPTRDIFWNKYIEPFLEDTTERLIDLISKECQKNKLNIRTELDILSQHLRGIYVSIYNEMADADQKMRGKGYPDKVERMSTTQRITDMNHYLDQHIGMALAKNKSKTSIKHQLITSLKDQSIEKIAACFIAIIVVIFKDHLITVFNSLTTPP